MKVSKDKLNEWIWSQPGAGWVCGTKSRIKGMYEKDEKDDICRIEGPGEGLNGHYDCGCSLELVHQTSTKPRITKMQTQHAG